VSVPRVRVSGRRHMRVLHVTPYFAPAFCYGGPPRSILGLCQGLQRAGVDLEVFTTTANGTSALVASPPEGDRYEGVRVRYFPLAFPRRLFGAARLSAAIGTEIDRYDLVHIHGLWNIPGWTAARQAQRAGVPYVISTRGMLDAGSLAHRARRKRLAYRAIERRNLAGAAFLHATSPAEAEALVRRGPGGPVVMVPNGVNLPAGAPPERGEFRRRLKLPGSVPLVAFLGRIHPIKRLDLVASAMERVWAVRGDAHLVIAGPDEGTHRREMEPRFSALGAATHWVGELDEVDKWGLLAATDALVMCSDSESFGMSVVEAMAAGVPPVVTQTCPWGEVETEGCGFWVPQNAEAIASALLALLNDPAKAREMGERGRALVRARYSWDSIGRAMAEQYRMAASSRRYVVLTPGLEGADGVAALSRLVVRTVRPARVLVLNDGVRRAWGRKFRFVAVVLRLAVQRNRYTDVLCLHLHLGPVARLLAARQSRLTIFLLGVEAWKPLSRLQRMALERSHSILSISEHTAHRFREANPEFTAQRVYVCHPAVRDEIGRATRDEPLPAASFALIVARMAAWERYKGHDLLITIWPRVAAEVPGARLMVVGDGDDRARLEARTAQLEGLVSFIGRVSDEALTALYQQCAFFVMPSRDEGFGLVFLEAMRAGKACIGAVGAAAEIIEDGVTGLVVDPGDPEQLLKAILRLFREPDTRVRMGQAGAARVTAQFTEAHFKRRLLGLLQGKVS
jgi:glycosyltransferase involved in cell wall biosynthesis